jgi:hypothetical protein
VGEDERGILMVTLAVFAEPRFGCMRITMDVIKAAGAADWWSCRFGAENVK